jgi:protein-disulfide isomerase
MDYLKQKGVSFTSKDIASDAQAFDELVKLGASGTPTIVVDDQVVVGFNPKKLDAVLA